MSEREFGKDWLHPCALHPEDQGWYKDEESIPSCPECGCMLAAEHCTWCGATWLSSGSSFDDVMSSVSINEFGDMMCVRCAEMEAEEEYDEAWEYA